MERSRYDCINHFKHINNKKPTLKFLQEGQNQAQKII